jgi:hypothetical protein
MPAASRKAGGQQLFGVFNSACFAHDSHANLARILQVVFDLFGNVATQLD